MSRTCGFCRRQVYGSCKWCNEVYCKECFTYVGDNNDDTSCYFCCETVCNDCSRMYRSETISHCICKSCLEDDVSSFKHIKCFVQNCIHNVIYYCVCCKKAECWRHKVSDYNINYCSDCNVNNHNDNPNFTCDRCCVSKCVGNEICRQKNFGNDTKNCTDCFRTNQNAIYTFLTFMRFRTQIPYDVAKLIAKMSRI